MESGLLIDAAGACGQLVLGLALLVVGAVTVRPVEATSGYLAIGAGLVLALDGCCAFVPIGLVASENWDALRDTSTAINWLSVLAVIAVGGLMIGSTFLLARKAAEGRPS